MIRSQIRSHNVNFAVERHSRVQLEVTVNQIPFGDARMAEGRTSAGQQVNRWHVLPVKSNNDVVRKGTRPTSSVFASLAIDTHAR